MQNKKLFLILISVIIVLCVGVIATYAITNNNNEKEPEVVYETKDEEVRAYKDKVEIETYGLLSKYYGKKIKVVSHDDKFEGTPSEDGHGLTDIRLTQKYVDLFDKAIKVIETKKLSVDEARILFSFILPDWNLYLDTTGAANTPEAFPELYGALMYYLSLDEKLEGDLSAAADPKMFWTKDAPYGNADRLED